MSINQPGPLLVGTRVNDRYVVLAVVGRGGLGTVYRVADEWQNPQQIFALKETFDLSDGAREQFMREARWLQQLNHTNIPNVVHHFQWKDRLYLVMDYVSGENLEQKLVRNHDRPLPEGEVIICIRPICDALAYLHAQNPPIIHRDVKPANIIVAPNGQPALVDLGIAKEHLPGMRNITATFIRKAGTEGYAPPEQYISNGTTGPWSDIYSLGATMYHLLTGRVPASAVERAALDGQLIAPRSLNPALSVHIEAIVMRALAIRPQDRFASMREMLVALNDESLTKTTSIPAGGPGLTKLPSKPLCPRCGRPMLAAAPLCQNCANDLAFKAGDALREAPGSPTQMGPRLSMPIAPSSSAILPGALVNGAPYPPIAPSASMITPSAALNGGQSHPTAGNSSHPSAISMNGAPRTGARPLGRKAIERPRRVTRQVQRAAARAAAPTAPGSQEVGKQSERAATSRFPWRALLIAVIVLGVLGGGFALGSRALSLLFLDESSPTATARGYFSALKSHDYQKAYSFFSPKGVAATSYDRFVNAQNAETSRLGDITAIQSQPQVATIDNDTRQIQIEITHSLVSNPVIYTLTISATGDRWQIDSVASGG